MTKPTQTTKNGEKMVSQQTSLVWVIFYMKAINTPPPYANERDSSNSHKRRKIRVKLKTT